MKFLKMNKAIALFYSIVSLSFLLSACHPEDEHELPQPEPIAEQPQPEPPANNPDDCLTKAASDNGSVIAGEYLVTCKEQQGGLSIQSNAPWEILSRKNIPVTAARHIFSGRCKIFAARLTSAQVESLRKDPSVESIEPDRVISIVSCYTEINDQTIPWGVQRVGYGDGTGKTIWIIDTGVDLDHPDLNVDVSRSKSFISGTTPDDDHGHGTHVAGTAAAKNNHTGVSGVAANAKIVSLKVMDQGGKGSISNVIAAVNHVAQHGKAGDVVNMSIGGDVSKVLDQAILDAADKGIYFAVAAGNASMPACGTSPAKVNHINVFTVSAMDDKDNWASFSNYGSECVDYCAPGVSIASTHKNGGYATMNGTSMATPHVAGLLLLKGRNILTDGFVKNDPDGKPDPIAHK